MTGLSAFAAKVLTIPTGLVFLVMVVRTLTTSQFGVWEVITTVLAFSQYPSGLVNFWGTREAARGRLVGATALVANLALSVAGVSIYLSFAILSYGRISEALYPFLVGSVLVPVGYW